MSRARRCTCLRLTWCAAPRRPRSAARHWCRFFRVYCRGSLHRTTRWVRLRLRVARWRGPKKLKLKRLRAQKPADASTVTKFHARVPPSIAIRDYLERYARGAACGLQGRCRPPDGVGRAQRGRAVAPPRLTRARARARACRILKYAACSSECFVLALVYIDRLIQRNDLVLSTLNVHRIIITRWAAVTRAAAAAVQRVQPPTSIVPLQCHARCEIF